jgi:hydroxymethylpyrimidine/phosphomethylpyrimidine kinase
MNDALPVALTIAGSDSGGGAGVQADLKVFARCGVHGTSAVTAVTAQNLGGVRAVAPIAAPIVAEQLRAVLEGFAPTAAKTGMLWAAELVATVARFAAEPGFPPLVVDPVMVATSGARLLREDAVAAYRELLLPRAAIVTPNLDEAAVLLGATVDGEEAMADAAAALARRCGCRAVLLKGGHLAGDPLDVLWLEGRAVRWRHRRVAGVHSHGTGCALSAAIAAGLARGSALEAACAAAVELVARALERPHIVAGGARVLGL